ncbi:hypothetical protein IAR55_003352 [Kwoniella newhampshirensis]|uniref:Uncharacterized protein n=1 Tax=Kwoniella newhampshirensis TaxID=1651941 RepID=A0AAW0Z1C0_9TREE
MEAVMPMVDQIMDSDPYLEYQPAFAYALPIQLLVNGITVTLLCVLLIHLLFTTQYHYPLAPLNYILQLLSILTVLISVIIKIVIILDQTSDSADQWPYSLDYVAVSIPPQSWTTGRCAAWFLLQALNNGLSNITHIQFLTLLYPSRTEARLIIFVLGPLAIASSALVFSALSPHQTVLDISDAIRNVFNSTLLLIFTISLVIWGFFVNRRRAWRFDGGTAVFGVGSLFLAAVSTSFNFVAVAEDGIDWLQHLLFAAVLWQVWLGWWWWVGSGMGIGEVEDIMERAERKKRKQAKVASRARAAAARSNAKPTANSPNTSVTGRLRAGSLAAGLADGFASGVTSILKNSRSGNLTRRQTARSYSNDEHRAEEGSLAIEMDDLARRRQTEDEQHVEFEASQAQGPSASDSNANSNSRTGGGTIRQSTNSETSSTSATPSLHPPTTLGQLFSYPTTWLAVYLRRLRKAHEEAAKSQALERAEKRQKVFSEGGEAARPDSVIGTSSGGGPGIGLAQAQRASARQEAGVVSGEDVGWGLGRFGIRKHEESARRLRQAGEIMSDNRLLSGQVGESTPDEVVGESSRTGTMALAPETSGRTAAGLAGDGDWEDIDSSNDTSSSGAAAAARRKASNGKGKRKAEGQEQGERPDQPVDRTGQGSGWSWWGPLKEWRLNDRSLF